MLFKLAGLLLQTLTEDEHMGPPPIHPPEEACSFCDGGVKSRKLLVRAERVSICDECIDICVDIMEEGNVTLPALQRAERRERELGLRVSFPAPPPRTSIDCACVGPGDDTGLAVMTDHVVRPLGKRGSNVESIPSAGDLVAAAWHTIRQARLLFADVTGRDPRVLYCIGLAHAVGTPVCILARSIDDVPFDLRHHRSIRYEYSPSGTLRLEADVCRTVDAVKSSGLSLDSLKPFVVPLVAGTTSTRVPPPPVKKEPAKPPAVGAACTFCGKSSAILQRLIVAREDRVYICNECLDVCIEIVQEKNPQYRRPTSIDLTKVGLRPIFAKCSFQIAQNSCFYIGPFEQPFDRIYGEQLKSVTDTYGLRLTRGDEIYGVRPIMEDVWEAINTAELIVADITHRNPNVMYELGVAHAVGRPTFLLEQRREGAARFCVTETRPIYYEYTPSGCAGLRECLETGIREFMSR